MNTKIKAVLTVLVVVMMAAALTACGADQSEEIAQLEAALEEAQSQAEDAVSEEQLEAAQAELEAAQAALEEALAAAEAVQEEDTEEDFLTWFQYDETNEDPASDERVGNEYLRETIPQFNEDFEGKWNWVNRPKAFDTMYQELVAAVIAGNTVPDIIEMGSSELNLVVRKGAVQDLSDWAEQQVWYDDLDKGALETCTSDDGQLFCIPFAVRPHLVYVWADHYPDGYPDTPEEFMAEAERLKEDGIYAWTYFGSTDFGGDGATRMVWSLVDSFGGTYDDGEGNLYLTSPETVAAIEFLRETVAEGYNPETVFAGGFIEEDSFKDASAGSIPTGLFGYRYINPLTAPDGTEYSKGSAEDMLDAIAAGDVVLSEMFAPEGQTPGCGTDIQGLAIPVGAENVEAAHDFINWLMEPERNVAFVAGPGAGTPANTAIFDAPEFSTPFYQEAAKALENSVCTPWYGSLERRGEAKELIMNAVYKVVKEDPSADIVEVFTAAEEEYNAANE